MTAPQGGPIWPPAPASVPEPAQLLAALQQALASSSEAPDGEEVLDALHELIDDGAPDFRTEPRSTGLLEQLLDRLDEGGRALLLRYEERINELGDRWATDRFRVGFAMGASLSHILREQVPAGEDGA